jgi:hypothetical protein
LGAVPRRPTSFLSTVSGSETTMKVVCDSSLSGERSPTAGYEIAPASLSAARSSQV